MEPLTPLRVRRSSWIAHGVVLGFLLLGPAAAATVISGLTSIVTSPITRDVNFASNRFEIFNVELLMIYVIGAVGLNLLVQTGLISIGHSAMFALGAYFVGAATVHHGWSFWTALLCGTLLAGFSGLLLGLPALRLGQFTLAMVTVGYAFVAQDLANNLKSLTDGGDGLVGVEMPAPFDSLNRYYWLVLSGAVLVYILSRNLVRSPFGRASKAVEQSSVAAQSLGISVYVTKLRAFAVSSAIAGLAGGLYAPLLSVVAPDAFDANLSILLLLMVLLGGGGTVLGPVIGAVLLFRIPIEVQRVTSQPGDWSLLIYGAVLLLSVYLVPRGLMSAWWWLRSRVEQRRPAETAARVEADITKVVARVKNGGSEPVLEAHGINKVIGGLTVLQNVDIVVRPGHVHGLIGPNGSGKTTLLNVLCGYVLPDSGRVAVIGSEPRPGRPHLRARRGVGRTFQTPTLFEGVSCVENVLVALDHSRRSSIVSAVLRLPHALREERRHFARAMELLAAVGLASRAATPAASLPPGERRLLEVARVLALQPRVVLMDEPAAGLSGPEIDELGGVIRSLREAGIGVLLVEHHVDLVMALADELTVLDFGKVIAHGDPETVRHDPAVIAAYLGSVEQKEERLEHVELEVVAREAVGAAGGNGPRPLLCVSGLVGGYGRVAVLHDVTFEVAQGETVVLIGSNGAGKSTILRTISGLNRPFSGSITFDGKDISRHGAPRTAAHGVAHVPENRRIFAPHTVEDNLRIGGFVQRRDRAAVEEDLKRMFERFPILEERRRKPAGSLSGGQQQILAVAMALMARPLLLMLDEPSLGLAPRVVENVYDEIRRLRESGSTILLVEQLANVALDVADRAVILRLGHVVAEGAADEIRRDEAIRSAYLGG